jgi:hypothetical protein
MSKSFQMERKMISKKLQQIPSVLICTTLLVLGLPVGPANAFQDQSASQVPSQTPAQQQPTPDTSSASAAPTAVPLTADQLDALVAPIALYPDALVAEVLGAATFPEQVAIADYWLSQNKSLTGTALAQAADQQPWDDSVKALTQFPAVLDNMASNLTWTSNLGQAFHDQQADVMAAVQVMRAKAQAAGTLQSTPQVKVVQQTPQTIVIQPANPQVVYVPQYNPTVVYGGSYVVPFYTPPVAIAAATVSFGAGIAIGAAFGGGGFVGGGGFGFGWGFGSWGCNWGGGGGGGTVIYNHNTYISNRSWHGGNTYNNYHPWGPGPHGQGPYGPHGYQPNGGRNGDHGLIGGNGGVQHQPDGGRNGDHGLIGGIGGVQHTGADQPNGGRNGDHGLIGGNGGVDHGPDGGRNGDGGKIGGQGGTQHPDQRFNPRSRMSGNGPASRAESSRGRTSMHQPAVHRAPQQHRQAAPHRSGGGGGRRR